MYPRIRNLREDKELEKVANEYAAPIPNVEWNAETILDLFYCRIHEPIGSTIVVLDETRNYRYAFPERSIIGALMGVRLDADTEEGLMAIFKAYWSQLEKEYCTSSTTARSLIMEIRPEDEKRVVTGNFFTRDGESAQAQRDEELRLQRMQKIREAEERKYSIQSEKQKNAGGGLFSEIVKKIHTPAREFDEFSYDFLTEDDKSLEYKLEEEEKPKRNIAAVAKTLYYGDPNPQRDEEIRKLRERKIRETESRKMSCQPPKSRGGYLSGLARKMKEVTNNIDTLANDFLIEEEQSETLTQEDKQLLREIQERIERLHHSGIRQQLIEQMVRMTVKPSVLQVGDDARLLLTNYNKEVNMLPIDKLVYIFFLRHPEGVALKDMSDHKEELTGLYQRVLGREKLSKTQSKSVDLLCDPLNNSINEKLSRIRQAFRAVAHDSVANCYVIQGERGEKRSITLSDEYIELGEWGK